MSETKFTPQEFIKAAELAKTNLADARFICSLLIEARFLLGREYHPETTYVPTTVENLFKEICVVSGFTSEDFKSRNRKRELSYTRHVFCSLACDFFPDETMDNIGRYVGVKHDLVIYYKHQVKEVKEKYNFYLKMREDLGL